MRKFIVVSSKKVEKIKKKLKSLEKSDQFLHSFLIKLLKTFIVNLLSGVYRSNQT